MNIEAKTNGNLTTQNIKLPKPPQVKNKMPNVQHKAIKLPEGAKKIGNYILGKTIGTGTFGKVHLGLHALIGEKVAVKIIQKQKIAGKDIQRVKNQIQILSSTRHRNLVHLYQIIQTQKSLLLITQYFPNGELFNRIVKEKKLSEQQACHNFHQIIDGLQYMHKMGIAHRDLKPQNVMIDYDNQAKIIDFGLSKSYGKNQKLHSACGSPCYASPQMIQGKGPYYPQFTDVWSCGVLLYAMVHGTLPFIDSDTPKLYKKILSGVYQPIKNVSSALKDLIQKMLMVNPKKRISINEIKNHQWWNLVPYRQGFGLMKGQRVTYDEEVVAKTSALGFQRKKIIESLQNDQKNKQTGAYFILMKKMVKAGAQIPRYIGNSHFSSSTLENIFGQDNSDTIEGPQCVADAPMPSNLLEEPSCACTENTKPFEWWVVIGTKQYEKVGYSRYLHNTPKDMNSSSSLISDMLKLNNKNSIKQNNLIIQQAMFERKSQIMKKKNKIQTAHQINQHVKDKGSFLLNGIFNFNKKSQIQKKMLEKEQTKNQSQSQSQKLKKRKNQFYQNNEKLHLASTVLARKGPIKDASFFYKSSNRNKSTSLYQSKVPNKVKVKPKVCSSSSISDKYNVLPSIVHKKTQQKVGNPFTFL